MGNKRLHENNTIKTKGIMENKTHNKRRTILIGLGVLGTGVAGFLGWNYWKNKKKAVNKYFSCYGTMDKLKGNGFLPIPFLNENHTNLFYC